MRSFFLSASLLAAMLLLTLANSRHLERLTGEWIARLDQADLALDAQDWPAAAEASRAAYDQWQANQFYLHITVRHEELDQAQALFLQLLVLCDEEDAPEARLHLADLRSQLQLLAEMERLSIPNIL